MEQLTCKSCGGVVGETAGNLVVLVHGRERTEIVGAQEVTRTCRRCGTKNTLYHEAATTAS